MNYSCLFDSIEVDAYIVYYNDSYFKLNCVCPYMESKNIIFNLKSQNGEIISYNGIFSVFGTCPTSGCNRNDSIMRGYCLYGQCECLSPYEGQNCELMLVSPVLNPINDVNVYQFDSISVPIRTISASDPIQLTLVFAPSAVQLINLSLIWSNIDTTQQVNEITLQAKNKIGTAYLSFNVNVIQKYIIVFNNLTKSLFENPQTVIIFGTLRLKSNPMIIYNRSCSFNLKIERGYYNDQYNIRLNTHSDGSFFYAYIPNQNEFGSYSIDAKNDLDTSPFQNKLNWFYLGTLKVLINIFLSWQYIS